MHILEEMFIFKIFTFCFDPYFQGSRNVTKTALKGSKTHTA